MLGLVTNELNCVESKLALDSNPARFATNGQRALSVRYIADRKPSLSCTTKNKQPFLFGTTKNKQPFLFVCERVRGS